MPEGLTGLRREGGIVRGLPFEIFTKGYSKSFLAVAAHLDSWSMAKRAWLFDHPDEIAKCCKLSPSMVEKTIKRMIEEGWIAVTQHKTGGRNRMVYWLRWKLPDPDFAGGVKERLQEVSSEPEAGEELPLMQYLDAKAGRKRGPT